MIRHYQEDPDKAISYNDYMNHEYGESSRYRTDVIHHSMVIKGEWESYTFNTRNLIVKFPEEERDRVYLYKLINKKNPNKTPKKVYWDGRVNDDLFMSMCGYFCAECDYEKTDQYKKIEDFNKDKPIKFSDIPAEFYLTSTCTMHDPYSFQESSGARRTIKHSKYKTLDQWDITTQKRVRFGLGSQYGNDGGEYAICRFFYDEDKRTNELYNPGKKMVKVKRFLSSDLFLTESDYICEIGNYLMGFISESEYKVLMRRRWYLIT